MEISEFTGRLRDGKAAGWYLFSGEEDYLKKYYLRELAAAVVPDGGLAAFNHIVFDGAEPDCAALTDAIKSPPMMAERKLVEWRYADFEKMREGTRRAIEELAPLREEYPYTTVAFLCAAEGFDAGSAKRPGKQAVRFGKIFDILNFPKSTDRQLMAWLKKHFDAEGIGVTADSLSALLLRSGHSMQVLNGEVEKLAAYIKENGRRELTVADVEHVASGTVECDTFTLSNALTDRDGAAAFRALAELKARRTDPSVIIGMMARTFSEFLAVVGMITDGKDANDVAAILKINPYKVKLYAKAAKNRPPEDIARVLTRLAWVDAASKSGGASGYSAVEMFIAENI